MGMMVAASLTSTLSRISYEHWDLAQIDERSTAEQRHDFVLSVCDADVV